MPTPAPSPPGRSMYRRTTAPPGDGRYSTPSSSSPSDSTAGDSSAAMSVDLSATLPPGTSVPATGRARKTTKGPAGPLSDAAGSGAGAPRCAPREPDSRNRKKPPGRLSDDCEKLTADPGPGAPGGRHGGPYGPAEPLDYRAAPRPLQAASRRRGPQRQTARPEGRAACGVVVAGAGFEPATFGL